MAKRRPITRKKISKSKTSKLFLSVLKWKKKFFKKIHSVTKRVQETTIEIKARSGVIFERSQTWWQKRQKKQRRMIKKWRRAWRQNLGDFFLELKHVLGLDEWQTNWRWPKLKLKFKPFLKRYHRLWQHHYFLIVVSLAITLIILGLTTGLYLAIFKDLPSATDLTKQSLVLTTTIKDRDGQVLYRIYKDENRTLVPLKKIPQNLINATIAIEDRDFYYHHGFSVKGIIRAFLSNLKGESTQGGSTITQQLVKNRLLTPERTLRRKIREVILAVLVDGAYTKNEILSMYLNEVPYGGSTYGIEAAAERYFGKSVQDLNLAESALLAGLPAAPSLYSPFGPNPEAAYLRQAEVLRRMVEDGYISEEQALSAKKEVLNFQTDTTDIKAPHFVMYVKQLLAQEYGEDIVSQGGLDVKTTLDLDLQNAAQKIVTDEINKLSRLRISNGASLITNPQTGEILSMVGSKNYFDVTHDGQVNVTLRPRQPGSSIKPVTYSLAFESGKTPSSVIDDSPITYLIPGSKPYAPQNYDGRFHGRVTLREALASSYNIPAVKLEAELGLDRVIDQGEKLGISTWQDRSRYGLSLTLGGAEVLMSDMAKVYGTFANQGYTTDLNPILEIKNSRGETLYRNTCVLDQYNCPQTRTLSPLVAYQITSVLSDNRARTPVFGPRSVLNIPGQEVAVKTGTTNNLKDNWTIGYTTDRLVAVWVGNNDGSPMSYVASGITGASPIWNNLMRLFLDDKNPHHFATPEGLIKVSICGKTGTLPCKGCPNVREELFVPGTEPTQACNPAQFLPKPSPQPDQMSRDQILDGIIIN